MAKYVLGDGGHGRLIGLLTGAVCLGIDEPVPDVGGLFIGVGDPPRRRQLYEEYEGRILGVIDQSAVLAGDLRSGDGLQVMARATIVCGTQLGANVLVNTGAQIDHDCRIGDHCVIAPGAILCGTVTLGSSCFIGAGAIVLPGVTLYDDTFVPAGTLVAGSDDFRRPQRVLRLS